MPEPTKPKREQGIYLAPSEDYAPMPGSSDKFTPEGFWLALEAQREKLNAGPKLRGDSQHGEKVDRDKYGCQERSNR